MQMMGFSISLDFIFWCVRLFRKCYTELQVEADGLSLAVIVINLVATKNVLNEIIIIIFKWFGWIAADIMTCHSRKLRDLWTVVPLVKLYHTTTLNIYITWIWYLFESFFFHFLLHNLKWIHKKI